MFLKLQAMISTLDKFRVEMDGSRVPRYEVAYLQKKRDAVKERKREIRRQERQERKEKRHAEQIANELLYRQMTRE